MRWLHILTLSPLTLAGCLSPLTSRVDQTNQSLAVTNQMLMQASEQLDEMTQRLRGMEGKLTEMNQQLGNVGGQMGEMNRKLGTVEQGFSKFFGMKPK
jgi:hypothetical protein